MSTLEDDLSRVLRADAERAIPADTPIPALLLHRPADTAGARSVRRRGLFGAIAVAGVIAAVCVGVFGVHRSTNPAADNRIPISATGHCPPTLSFDDTDPVNSGAELAQRLLPVEQPTAGIVCQFENGTGRLRLVKGTELNAAEAGRLATSISAIAFGPSNVVDCPVAIIGSNTIIAFAYRDRQDVQLNYYTTGCPTLTNGQVTANAYTTSMTFSNGFLPTITQLTK